MHDYIDISIPVNQYSTCPIKNIEWCIIDVGNNALIKQEIEEGIDLAQNLDSSIHKLVYFQLEYKGEISSDDEYFENIVSYEWSVND